MKKKIKRKKNKKKNLLNKSLWNSPYKLLKKKGNF